MSDLERFTTSLANQLSAADVDWDKLTKGGEESKETLIEILKKARLESGVKLIDLVSEKYANNFLVEFCFDLKQKIVIKCGEDKALGEKIQNLYSKLYTSVYDDRHKPCAGRIPTWQEMERMAKTGIILGALKSYGFSGKDTNFLEILNRWSHMDVENIITLAANSSSKINSFIADPTAFIKGNDTVKAIDEAAQASADSSSKPEARGDTDADEVGLAAKKESIESAYKQLNRLYEVLKCLQLPEIEGNKYKNIAAELNQYESIQPTSNDSAEIITLRYQLAIVLLEFEIEEHKLMLLQLDHKLMLLQLDDVPVLLQLDDVPGVCAFSASVSRWSLAASIVKLAELNLQVAFYKLNNDGEVSEELTQQVTDLKGVVEAKVKTEKDKAAEVTQAVTGVEETVEEVCKVVCAFFGKVLRAGSGLINSQDGAGAGAGA